MKVIIRNLTGVNKFVDLDGKSNTDDIKVIGPRGTETVDLPSERRFIELSKQFKNQLSIKKVFNR